MRGGVAAIVILFALCTGHAAPARAELPDTGSTPMLLTADEMSFDRESGIVTARGNVEISQGGRVLRADELTYDQNTGVVTAHGNVSLTEPTGEVIFTEHVELSKNLREGVIDNLRMLFPDDSRFAATGAVRTGGNRTVMRRAVFSPCSLCPDDPTRPPLWQIRADRIIHDQQRKIVEYEDATMEMFGVPVAYAPVFSHPDPTVRRRSGLLPPTFGSDENLGFTTSVPYFIVLSDDWDATLSPIFATKENPVAAGEVRHRFRNGEFSASGSITRAAKRDLAGSDLGKDLTRGHIFSRARYDIDETWRTGYDAALTTDDTYLRRYNLSGPPTIVGSAERNDVLTSRGFLEGFRDLDYFSAQAFHFQGLRETDDQDTTAMPAPIVDYNLLSRPLFGGSRWNLDANLLNLFRLDGTDSRRLSFIGGWRLPYIGAIGDIYTVTATVQNDVYWVNDVMQPSGAESFNGVVHRFFPQASIDWRYPLVRELGNVRHLVEPRLNFTIGPNGHNDSRIPNEDSINFEFDDTNLFALNRFPGRDRVDGGKRFTYGISNAFYGDEGGQTEIFLGQSFRFRDDDTFLPGSGIGEDFSDIVGRVLLQPSDYLDLSYRFRLDREAFILRRNELGITAGPSAVKASANYLFFDEDTDFAEFDQREEISGGVVARVTENWTVAARGSYDLSPEGGPLQYGGGVTYQDECLLVSVDLARNFTTDRDLKASTEVFVRVVFKYLGEIGTGN